MARRATASVGWARVWTQRSILRNPTSHSILVGFAMSFLVLHVFTPAFSQVVFERTYGGVGFDEGNSVVQTTDGGYIICGRTDSFGAGGYDVYLIKTDAMGNMVWSQTYGGTQTEYGNAVQQTSDGGYVIAGTTGSYGSGALDIYLIKTDVSGNTIWERTFGTPSTYDHGESVQQTADGGYIIAGYTGVPSVYWHTIIIKTDASGVQILQGPVYGMGDTDNRAQSVQQTADGGYVVTGYAQPALFYDVLLLKYDASLNLQWDKTYGDVYTDQGFSVHQTTDGGYVVAGYQERGLTDVYLIKTDASGDTLWTRTYGGSNYDGGSCVDLTSDGGFVVAGYTQSYGAGLSDAYLLKTNSSGDLVWETAVGGNGWDHGYSVQQTSDGNYIMCGSTDPSGSEAADVYLIKYDANEGSAGPFGSSSPEALSVTQNYPNPFGSSTTIEYALPEGSGTTPVVVTIHDLRGKLIRRLVDMVLRPGSYRVRWDGTDDTRQSIISGTYVYTISAGTFSGRQKMVLVR